jgi:hypothetical protein
MAHVGHELHQVQPSCGEVDVDLDVLGLAVMNRVGCHVNNIDVIMEDNHGGGKW